MKLLRAVAIVAATLAATHCVLAAAAPQPSWEQWKKMHGRVYASPAEDARRKHIFENNAHRAAALQAMNPLAQFGVANEYADMSPAEFKTYHNGDKHFAREAARRKAAGEAGLYKVTDEERAAAPQAVDWRTKGAVTYVKNQGQCGSCWSFSTTGNIEGQWFLAGNKLVAVSEQELVSCDTIDSGCNGGLMDNAFTWLVQNRGGWITGESDYPYVSGQGTVPSCADSGMPKRAQITGHHDVQNSESAMSAYLAAHGPLSIGVDASSWQTYAGGILTNCVSQQVDHGVLAVGYDLTYTTPYWIVKNSWGASWGESGYIRVAYGSNQCLITSGPTSSLAGTGPAPPPSPTTPAPGSNSGSGSTNPPNPTPAPNSNSGSGSTNPPPPPPPSPNASTFTQNVCPTSSCSSGCQSNTFPTGSCLQLSGGGSAIATCTSILLVLNVYSTSSCTGSAQEQFQPLDTCLQDTSGSYIYNVCSGGSSGSSSQGDAAEAVVRRI